MAKPGATAWRGPWKYMGIERSTFLVDAQGIVAEVWRKVGVPGHVGAVLEASQKL